MAKVRFVNAITQVLIRSMEAHGTSHTQRIQCANSRYSSSRHAGMRLYSQCNSKDNMRNQHHVVTAHGVQRHVRKN